MKENRQRHAKSPHSLRVLFLSHQEYVAQFVLRYQRVATPKKPRFRSVSRRSCMTCLNAVYSCSLSLIHISEPTRLGMISYAVFCLKKKKKKSQNLIKTKLI